MEIKLPKSSSKHGYTLDEIKKFVTEDEYRKFLKWIGGQTAALIRGKVRYYHYDVERFLHIVRNGGIDIWD